MFSCAFVVFNLMAFPIAGITVAFLEPFGFRLSEVLCFVIMDLLLVICHVLCKSLSPLNIVLQCLEVLPSALLFKQRGILIVGYHSCSCPLLSVW